MIDLERYLDIYFSKGKKKKEKQKKEKEKKRETILTTRFLDLVNE